tara:strand:+ start:539 stop:2551 length:2013 start_codon:yes stop_codon:yes gene_type:complete
MSLLNLKSIFQEQAKLRAEDYISRRPEHSNDSRFEFNVPVPGLNFSSKFSDTPILDNILIPQSSLINFEQNTYDLRVPKNDGIKISNINSYKGSAKDSSGTNNLFVNTANLGRELGSSKGFEALYNNNHTPKPIPDTPDPNNPFQPYNYGSNVNRENLNIRNQDDGRFGFGGSFRTSAISAVGKLIGQVPFFQGNVQQFLQDTGKEPYIVSSIGDGGRLINSNFLDRGLPVERALTDTVRIGKYLTSPAGVLHSTKQNLLALQQVRLVDGNRTQLDKAGMKDFGAKFNLVYRPIYNPLSSLISTFGRAGGGVGGLIHKSEPGIGSLLGAFGDIPVGDIGFSVNSLLNAPYPNLQNEVFSENSQLVEILQSGRIFDLKAPSSVFTSDLPTTDNSPQKNSKFADGGVVTFDNQPYSPDLTGDKYSVNDTFRPPDVQSESGFGGDKVTLSSMIKGNTLDNIGGQTTGLNDDENKLSFDIEEQKEGMPFYFKDLRDDTYIFFRAYLDGITENVTPSWEEHVYVGRSEPVYTYTNAQRDISFNLNLVAHTKQELSKIYEKMNRLTSLCYPQYDVDNFLGGNKVRMKPPLTKFRMGEMFGSVNNEVLGFLQSVSYTIDESSTWEIDKNKRVPKNIIVSITYKVIHNEVPGLFDKNGELFNFYGYTGQETTQEINNG